jgi:ferredoxin-type protein NapG
MTETPKKKAPAKRPRRRLSRQEEGRRRFLRGGVVTAFILALQPLATWVSRRLGIARLRPPGALAESTFLGACIKCGQCVQVCPVEAILLADLDDGLGHGAPYIEPRDQACDFSCDALSCILACPTGALSHDLGAKEEVAIGVAKLTRPDACRARRGEGFEGAARGPEFRGRLRYEEVDRWVPQPIRDHSYDVELCDLCVRECPLGATALHLEPLADGSGSTPVVGEACVGCGVCEMICPEEPTCIEIIPAVVGVSA